MLYSPPVGLCRFAARDGGFSCLHGVPRSGYSSALTSAVHPAGLESTRRACEPLLFVNPTSAVEFRDMVKNQARIPQRWKSPFAGGRVQRPRARLQPDGPRGGPPPDENGNQVSARDRKCRLTMASCCSVKTEAGAEPRGRDFRDVRRGGEDRKRPITMGRRWCGKDDETSKCSCQGPAPSRQMKKTNVGASFQSSQPAHSGPRIPSGLTSVSAAAPNHADGRRRNPKDRITPM